IGRYRESEQEFQALERSIMTGRGRVVKVCLWSDEKGMPIICSGTIRRVYKETDKGWVYVPALRREVIFRPTEFLSQPLHVNAPLQDFHVAFNFRGPMADPVRLHRRIQHGEPYGPT